MRSLLLGAALPILLLTGAFACDFNREARQDQATTVVADCTGTNCMVSNPTDTTTPEPSAVDKRVPDPVQDCTGSNCNKPDPVQD
jgi:hypothetical protein